jgi:hypothetical protein
MTQKEKIKHFTMGLALVGLRVNEKTAEMISMVYEGIKKKKGKFSVNDAVAIEYAVMGELAEKEVVATSEPIEEKEEAA